MKQIKYDSVAIVHYRDERKARERRRAAQVRQQRINRLLSILYKLIVVVALLMVLAGAGMIDSGLMIATQLYGVMMMLGGFFVLAGCVIIYQEQGEKRGKY